MASPKPLPSHLKLINGRGNGRDSGGRPVKPELGWKRLPPTAPAWLEGEARRMWDDVVAELSRLGLLKPIDEGALAAYCVTWQRFVDASEIVARTGLVLDTEKGPVKNPAVLIVESASKELRAWSAEFGLTPSSESRLGKTEAPDGDDDNPFA